MELPVLDPFGDYQTRGYLRNFYREKDLKTVGRLETIAFQSQLSQVIRTLRRSPRLGYKDILQTHKAIFSTVYPWAGQDRAQNAPDIAIAKAGYKTLFAHPADVQRAGEYALELAQDGHTLRARPGQVFGYLAHSHPFLEGNGRTILTVYAELCRREGFYLEWHRIDKLPFLTLLTQELLAPGEDFDRFLLQYARLGKLSLARTSQHLRNNFQPLPRASG